MQKQGQIMAIGLLADRVNEDILTADGFEDAFMGICHQYGRPSVAAYDYYACINVLMDRDGISQEEAEEYLCNVIGAYLGESAPVFVSTIEKGIGG